MRTKRRQGEPTPINDVLPKILRAIKGDETLGKVRKAWAEAVGGEVASRTRVAAFADGQVRIEVASAALKHDLVTFRSQDLLNALRGSLPDLEVRGLSYRVAALR